MPLSVICLTLANSNFLLIKYLKTHAGLIPNSIKLFNVSFGGVVNPVLWSLSLLPATMVSTVKHKPSKFALLHLAIKSSVNDLSL